MIFSHTTKKYKYEHQRSFIINCTFQKVLIAKPKLAKLFVPHCSSSLFYTHVLTLQSIASQVHNTSTEESDYRSVMIQNITSSSVTLPLPYIGYMAETALFDNTALSALYHVN